MKTNKVLMKANNPKQIKKENKNVLEIIEKGLTEYYLTDIILQIFIGAPRAQFVHISRVLARVLLFAPGIKFKQNKNPFQELVW